MNRHEVMAAARPHVVRSASEVPTRTGCTAGVPMHLPVRDFHISVSQLRKLMRGIDRAGLEPRWPVLPLVPGVRVIIISDDEPRQGWVRAAS